MIADASRPLVFSVLLHAGILAVALLLWVPRNQEPVVVPLAFELFAGPVQTPSRAPSNPAMHTPAVVFPAVPVAVPRTVVPLAATVEDTAHREPMVVPVPTRRPPVVAPSTPAQVSIHMTAEEFLRKHPRSALPASAVPRTVTPSRRIDINRVMAISDDSAAAADGGLSAAYLARLMSKLRAAHEKPAGLDAGLQARVEFSIRADGTPADVRIIESSGSRAFDESVLAAFRGLRDLGAPPQGPSLGNRVTFRTSDGN